MKVVKFGGTSMANATQIKKVCDIVLADPKRRIVVVSAPGKRYDDDIKVTDLLINLADVSLNNQDCEQAIVAVVDRYREIADDFNLGSEIVAEIDKDIRDRVAMSKENADKYTDCLKAAGEDNAAKIMAAYLQSISVDAVYMNPKDAGLILEDSYGNASVLPESYNKLSGLKNDSRLIVFPGFFGYSNEGEVVTFSRGGSDITGAILAAATMAEVYENWTDVDSVYAANPRIIKNPQPIPVFTYEEMRELSYAGFSVLHEDSLEPVYRVGVPINIRNTNNPAAPGTMIVRSREHGEHPVVGIACDDGFASIYVSKYMMNKEIGFGRKLLQILEEAGISYDHVPSGIDNVSIIVREAQLKGKLEGVIDRIYNELKADSVRVEKNKALLMVVGQEMTKTIGLASRATRALANADINIEMINQGSSEVSLMFGIDADDAKKALVATYSEFFNN